MSPPRPLVRCPWRAQFCNPHRAHAPRAHTRAHSALFLSLPLPPSFALSRARVSSSGARHALSSMAYRPRRLHAAHRSSMPAVCLDDSHLMSTTCVSQLSAAPAAGPGAAIRSTANTGHELQITNEHRLGRWTVAGPCGAAIWERRMEGRVHAAHEELTAEGKVRPLQRPPPPPSRGIGRKPGRASPANAHLARG